MDIAVSSVSIGAWASGTSLAITKPTGLAVGDLMVAIVSYQKGRTLTVPSGWANNGVYNANIGEFRTVLSYKVADSSDVAASDFTWTISGGAESRAGCIMRITNWDSTMDLTGSITNGSNVDDDSTPTFAQTITPTRNNSLIIFASTASTAGGAITGSNYAMATDNPSWTEQVDINDGGNRGFFVATAIRSATSATGNFSLTASGGGAGVDWVSISAFILRTTQITASVSDTVNITDTISATRCRVATVTDTVSLTDDVEASNNEWNNLDKNTSTWNNLDKN